MIRKFSGNFFTRLNKEREREKETRIYIQTLIYIYRNSHLIIIKKYYLIFYFYVSIVLLSYFYFFFLFLNLLFRTRERLCITYAEWKLEGKSVMRCLHEFPCAKWHFARDYRGLVYGTQAKYKHIYIHTYIGKWRADSPTIAGYKHLLFSARQRRL